jgi:hypothetical protein
VLPAVPNRSTSAPIMYSGQLLNLLYVAIPVLPG